MEHKQMIKQRKLYTFITCIRLYGSAYINKSSIAKKHNPLTHGSIPYNIYCVLQFYIYTLLQGLWCHIAVTLSERNAMSY